MFCLQFNNNNNNNNNDNNNDNDNNNNNNNNDNDNFISVGDINMSVILPLDAGWPSSFVLSSKIPLIVRLPCSRTDVILSVIEIVRVKVSLMPSLPKYK